MRGAEERLHFLDWLRAVLVCFVVYAHLVFCGAQFGRPEDNGTPDDHAYNLKDPSHLAVRWISVARQWCIPMLFWISGAAHALSFGSASSGGLARGMRKTAALTALGVAGNAACWLLGPRDELCSFRRPCPGKGVLFDFTEDPYGGNLEPYLNQMWYTVMLLVLVPLNWPLFRAAGGRPGAVPLILQWSATSGLYVLLTAASWEDCGEPWLLLLWLGASEALFLVLAVSTSSSVRPPWLPLRSLHYACAALALVQLGASPISRGPVPNDISASYVLYLLLGTNRWLQLGFLMTLPRAPRAPACCAGDVQPLASRLWPLVLVLLVLCAPSTSWSMAGVLPYPLLPGTADRLLYAAGTLLAFFVVDRLSRSLECPPLPPLLARAALALYLLQVVFITIFLQLLQPWARSSLGPMPSSADGTGPLHAIFALSLVSSLVVAAAAGAMRERRQRGLPGGSPAQVLQSSGGEMEA